MQNKLTLSSLPTEIRQLIYWNLSGKDVANLMKTWKFVERDFSHNSYLEKYINEKILQKVKMLNLFCLKLDDKENSIQFLLRDMKFEHKKILFEIISKFLNYTLEPSTSYGMALGPLVSLLLEKENIAKLQPQLIEGQANKYFLSNEVEEEIICKSPILFTLAHRIQNLFLFPNNHKYDYLYLAAYATKGKDIVTLNSIAKSLIDANEIASPWSIAAKPYILSKLKALFENKYQLPKMEMESELFEGLLKLFARCSPHNFDKNFPILYRKFETNLKNILQLDTKIIPLLDGDKSHEWIDIYPVKYLTDLMKSSKMLLCLSNISQKHYETLRQDKQLLRILTNIVLSTRHTMPLERLAFIKFFGTFLNHFFDLEGVQKTLKLNNLSFFFYSFSEIQDHVSMLNIIFKYSLDQLKYLPRQVIDHFREFDKFLAEHMTNAKEENRNSIFYEKLYFDFWKQAVGIKKDLKKQVKLYLEKNKPNLSQWSYHAFSNIKISTLKNISDQLLDTLTPIEFTLIYDYFASYESGKLTSTEDTLLYNFFKEPKNNNFLITFMNSSLVKTSDRSFDHLRNLAKYLINGRSIFDFLYGNEAFIDAIFAYKLIDFCTREITTSGPPMWSSAINIKEELRVIIEQGIYDFIISSPQNIKIWMDYIFPHNPEEKIAQLAKVIEIITPSEHSLLFRYLHPEVLCALARKDSQGSSPLEILAKSIKPEEFIKTLRLVDPNLTLAIEKKLPKTQQASTQTRFFNRKRKIGEVNDVEQEASIETQELNNSKGQGK